MDELEFLKKYLKDYNPEPSRGPASEMTTDQALLNLNGASDTMDDSDEVSDDSYSSMPINIGPAYTEPNLPSYPQVELQSPGAKQYQDVVSKQMDFLSNQKKSADSKYENLLSKRSDIKKPETDPFDKILGAMVPLAVAALGGEAGAMSQPSAFKSYQGYLDKEQEKNQKQYKEDLKNNELKLTAAERQSNSIQNRQNNLTTDSAWKTAQMEQADVKDNKDFEQQVALAKLNASMRRAGQPISGSDKNIVRVLSNATGAAMVSLSKFRKLQQQVNDPNFDPKIQVQAVKDELKTLNSPTNPDVVSAPEAERLMAFLNKAPDLMGEKGMKIGYDLPNFRIQLENSIKRLEGVIEDNKANIRAIENPGMDIKVPGGLQKKPAPQNQQAQVPPKQKPQSFKRKDGSTVYLQPDGTYK